MTLDAQHFGNHLYFLARLTEPFQTHATANVRQLPRQVNERAFGPDVFGGAFSDDVCTGRLIPLSFHLETGEVTWSRAIVCFDSGHARASFTENRMYVSYKTYSSSALNFSNTEKSSSVVTSPATEPLVAISRRSLRMIF